MLTRECAGGVVFIDNSVFILKNHKENGFYRKVL